MAERGLPLLQLYERIDRLLALEHFADQREDEEILFSARRHAFFLVRSILIPLVLLVLVLSVLTGVGLLSRLVSFLGFFGIPIAAVVFLLIVLGVVFWGLLEWENDHFFVTNQRVIAIRRIYQVYEERREAEVGRVQDVTTKIRGLAGTLLGFADIHIATAGALGNIVFLGVAEPGYIAELILRQREAASSARLETSRYAVKETLERGMGIN